MPKVLKPTSERYSMILPETTHTHVKFLFLDVNQPCTVLGKTVELGILLNASEFCDIIPTTQLGKFFKFSVTRGNQTGVVFFSERMSGFLSEVSNIQFDDTFYTVPKQFTKMWTIIVSVGRHTLPAIHCLMSGKSQDLYQALLDNIFSKIPNFRPSMSDWEQAPRNAIKEVLPLIKNYGCWFHFTQRIWAKTQKIGLAEDFMHNQEVANYIRQIINIATSS